MPSIIQTTLHFMLLHVPVIMLLLAALISVVIITRKKRFVSKAKNINCVLSLMMLLCVGFSSFWAFIMLSCFSVFTAGLLGWQHSPFQISVGIAYLAIGLAGVISYEDNPGFRAATTLIFSIFSWGIAAHYSYWSITTHANTTLKISSLFYTDIITPVVLIILLALHNKHSRKVFSL